MPDRWNITFTPEGESFDAVNRKASIESLEFFARLTLDGVPESMQQATVSIDGATVTLATFLQVCYFISLSELLAQHGYTEELRHLHEEIAGFAEEANYALENNPDLQKYLQDHPEGVKRLKSLREKAEERQCSCAGSVPTER